MFVLTGFWHGASWNFLVWGLFHGFFLACEHAGMSRVLRNVWKPVRHLYVLLVVIVGWVFFRADDLPHAVAYLASMFNISETSLDAFVLSQIVSTEFLMALAAGTVISMPLYPWLAHRRPESALVETSSRSLKESATFRGVEVVMLLMLCGLSILKISASTYNPFIYFRF